MHHKIEIFGRLSRDPELRNTPTGKAVTNFSVAANRRYTDGSGEEVQETIWFRVTTWGKLAEITHEHLSKGRLVYIEGRLQADPATGGPRTFTRQDGTVGASFEVTATNVLFLSSREGDDEAAAEALAEEVPF